MTTNFKIRRKSTRRGNAAVEYAVVLGLIVIACIGSLQVLGRNLRQTMQRAADAIGAGSQSGPTGSPQAGGTTAPPEEFHASPAPGPTN